MNKTRSFDFSPSRVTRSRTERALQMVKTHDKISGPFRSNDHLDSFVVVRSFPPNRK